MAKKKARRVAEAVAAEASGTTETDKYMDRLMGRLSKMGGLIQKSVPWLAIMDMIMKMIEACGSTNSARIVRRTPTQRSGSRRDGILTGHRHSSGCTAKQRDQ